MSASFLGRLSRGAPSALRISLVALLALVACRSGGRPRPPESDLERALYFVERDAGEDLHPISGTALASGTAEVTTVPWNHPVDVASRVEVRWDKSKLVPLVGTAEIPPVDQLIAPRARRLTALLDALARMSETRATALTRWRALEAAARGAPDEAALAQAFDEALAPLTVAKREFFALIEELYPDTPETLAARKEVERLFKDMLRTPAKAEAGRAFLQAEIDDLERVTRATVQRARRDFALRLEAFLIAEGKEPVALHMEGYDTIAAMQVQSIDRFGLALGSAERERLMRMLASAREIADAANRLRAGEARLEDALDGASGDLARKLDAFVTEAQALARDWATVAEEQAWKSTLDSVQPLVEALRGTLAEQLAAEGQRLQDEARAKLEEWSEHSAFVASLQATLALVPRLRDALEGGATPAEAIELALLLNEAWRGLADDLEARRALLDGAHQLVASVLGDWARLRPELAQGIQRAYAESALARELELWRARMVRTRALLGPIARYASIVEQARPLAASVRVPEALDVPLDDAPGTAIDLTRSESKPGDRIEVRATLLAQGTVQSTSSASFALQKLGWHADLVPAVVLVTADQLAGADDSGGFTASLSWMLRYGPRPDETDFLAHSAQWLGWGVGLHATLLHFDPDDDVEIGLGATLGLWGERLLVGAGIDPLADSDQDGRFYYFVGSSLIPLLQALQAE